MPRFLALAFSLALGLVTGLAGAPAASRDVDLLLVLAVDVSRSVDDHEYELQRRGYADAFRHPAVLEAIQANEHKAIAVTLFEWAGVDFQAVQVPWTIVSDEESGALFAEMLLAQTRAFNGWTSISGAIDFGVMLFARSPHAAQRRVIDVSGDGPNNSGRNAADARDDAVRAGITVNGLVIMNDTPTPGSFFRMPQTPLDEYFRDNVIGGSGAFVIAIDDFESFAYAIRNKLLREIAAAPGDRSLAEARVLRLPAAP
jgi:hypothetical protein